MSSLPFTRLFAKPAPPTESPPRDARELIRAVERDLTARGVASTVGAHAIWAKLEGGEVRIDFTPLPGPVPRLMVVPEAPESDAELIARIDRQDAVERARVEREYPIGPDGEPAWHPRRKRGDAGDDEALRAAMRDEAY